MSINYLQSQKTLQTWLYSGIALIVLSMLFLGRSIEANSFLIQAVSVLAAPLFFYGVGVLVYRYLTAPLAAPGIVATGAWLTVVALIHLYIERVLLPTSLQPYYWPVASLLTAALITFTGHRIHTGLLIPLVPLVQINALWAIIIGAGISTAWMPAITFLLILAWWELPFKDQEWSDAYKISGVLLAPVLIGLSNAFNTSTVNSVMVTWATGALIATFIGIRYGARSFGPLAIVMLVAASMWGLDPALWPLAWLVLATVTIIFIEFYASRNDGKDTGVDTGLTALIAISTALAVILSGAAALFSATAFYWGITMNPAFVMLMHLEAGLLLSWLGWRRNTVIAAHIGLWLIAAAWAELYLIAFNTNEAFGVWLGFLSTIALLVERLFSSKQKKKDKQTSIQSAMMRWPLADLSIGLSIIIVLWISYNLTVATPLVTAITTLIVIGVWITAGLIYKLPILLHVALWMAPLPYMLLVMYVLSPFRSLPMVGLAWQFLAVGILVFGHSLRRYRPAILMPFFIVGYVLMSASLTLMMANPMLLIVGLGLTTIVALLTSLAIVMDQHPAWTIFVTWLIPPEKRPYAFKSVHNAFLLLGSWLAVVWLRLTLEETALSFSQQGLVLVVLSTAWIMLGRILPRIPGAVGWPVYVAGWFMWFLGLLQVFLTPTEALFTIILGLVISVEALNRTKELYWLPILIMQVLFTVLQITYLLALPTISVVFLVMIAIGIGGMIYENYTKRFGRTIVITASMMASGLWFIQPDLLISGGMAVLVIAALIHYRHWELLFALYLVAGVIIYELEIVISWQGLMAIGIAQYGLGLIIAITTRPFRHRRTPQLLITEFDWATPLLWIGSLCILGATYIAVTSSENAVAALSTITLTLTLTSAIGALLTGIRGAPFYAVAFATLTVFLRAISFEIYAMTFTDVTNTWAWGILMMTFTALVLRGVYTLSVSHIRPFPKLRRLVWWLRPMLETTHILTMVSTVVFILVALLGRVSPVLLATNSALLTVMACVLLIQNTRRLWLWYALAMGWVTWLLLLTIVGIKLPFMVVLPLGVIALMLGVWLDTSEDHTFETLGIIALVGGSGFGVFLNGLFSIDTICVGITLLGLAGYGYFVGRRIPFVSAVGIISAGVIFNVLTLNFWIIPLFAGLCLLGGALLLEVRGDFLEQHVMRWRNRWQNWR